MFMVRYEKPDDVERPVRLRLVTDYQGAEIVKHILENADRYPERVCFKANKGIVMKENANKRLKKIEEWMMDTEHSSMALAISMGFLAFAMLLLAIRILTGWW